MTPINYTLPSVVNADGEITIPEGVTVVNIVAQETFAENRDIFALPPDAASFNIDQFLAPDLQKTPAQAPMPAPMEVIEPPLELPAPQPSAPISEPAAPEASPQAPKKRKRPPAPSPKRSQEVIDLTEKDIVPPPIQPSVFIPTQLLLTPIPTPPPPTQRPSLYFSKKTLTFDGIARLIIQSKAGKSIEEILSEMGVPPRLMKMFTNQASRFLKKPQ
jgi:hypothetical protein